MACNAALSSWKLMMSTEERERLIDEIAMLQRLRGELPPDHVLERSGFGQRLEMLEEMLAAANSPAKKLE